jgi:SAM-dependent methyltransferase
VSTLRTGVEERLAWGWGSKVSAQLLVDGLKSVDGLFRGSVLDLGCGMKPYQATLGSHVSRWVGVDHERTPSGRSKADVFGSAMAIPFASGRFDLVLCTQVLEHVPKPVELLCEVHRVLKPGGVVVLTAPQTNPLHEEPHDYHRFTCHGLQWLAQDAGFTAIETRPLGGAIATVGQMFIWHLSWLARFPVIGKSVHMLVNGMLAWIVLRLDPWSPRLGPGGSKDTINWLLVAYRPRRGPQNPSAIISPAVR